MICKEVMRKLEERWNPSYALEWDNVGLLVGREEKEIKKIFTALDATEETIAQALEFGADLLITHHPMIFSPVKKVISADFIGRRLITMIQADLCYYAMHTNFDVKGMAQLNQECLGLTDCEVLEETAPGEGIGRVGALEGTMDLKQFAGKVRNDFEIPDVRMYGDPAAIIHRVAVSSGSGKSMIRGAIEKGADVIVTGDVDYHSAIDAVAQGIAVIDAGHYGTEYGFIAYMRQELETMFPELAVGAARVHHPYRVV